MFCKFNLNELSTERKTCIYSCFPCTNFNKIMPNLNTAKFQTHVSFGGNFVSTYKNPRNGTWHCVARIILRIKKFTKRHARSCRDVLSCFLMKYISRIGTTSYQMHATKYGARMRVDSGGLFCFKFEAPCRFLILIISL